MPCPTCDSTQILPPCISTMRLDMASPSPVPPFLRVIALSACWNSWNSFDRQRRCRVRCRIPTDEMSRRLRWL